MIINKKIAIVGYGYWGKIIHRNLIDMGFKSIIICDTTLKKNNDYKALENIANVFIATPIKFQYEIANFFLKKKINVFSEKIFALNLGQLQYSTKLANKNNVKFRIGFIYLFNEKIKKIKEYLQKNNLKSPKYIFFSRKNFGPIRENSSSFLDLAVHDITILNELIEFKKVNFLNKNFYRLNKKNLDDNYNISFIYNKKARIEMHGDWMFPHKKRSLVIKYENDIISFDENENYFTHINSNNVNENFLKKTIKKKEINFINLKSPMHLQLKSFLSKNNNDQAYYFKKYNQIIDLVYEMYSSKKI